MFDDEVIYASLRVQEGITARHLRPACLYIRRVEQYTPIYPARYHLKFGAKSRSLCWIQNAGRDYKSHRFSTNNFSANIENFTIPPPCSPYPSRSFLRLSRVHNI
jgi:hypothetical protein